MPEVRFTEDELTAFREWLARTSGSQAWFRRDGLHGEDVIELEVGEKAPSVRIAKTKSGFMATGFDGWGLTVCDGFPELLDILSSYQPRLNARPAGRSRAA